jgi:fatty-acyl-CoA synthase
MATLESRGSKTSVARLIRQQARIRPDQVAVDDGTRQLTYAQLESRSRRLATHLHGLGVTRGERVAVLSENRLEYLELFLAAARLGAIAACQNWRLSDRELDHCIGIVEPVVLLVSPRHRDAAPGFGGPRIEYGPQYETIIETSDEVIDVVDIDPEDTLLILYTSGTTGLPKGAMLSHRAEISRNLVLRAEFGIASTDTFVAWSPLFHMGAAECALGTLMTGGKVITVDGYDADRLGDVVASEALGWLLLMPGMVGRFADHLESRGIEPVGVKVCGVMADLIPPDEIARVTALLDAPFANTFGATETGCPPCSSSLIPVGVTPASLSKEQSPFCEIRLVDAGDREVADGSPGELCMRGPTLFSGYWREPEVNAEDFRGGWFHMGDVFVRNPDGTLDFVDRVKYLIKSGGENIYPAEIERVLLAHDAVADAAVVRQPDERWGEVPVAFVARRDDSATEDELRRACAAELARYKHPKRFVFVALDELPRSASGKVQRHELERRLAEQEPT